MWSLRKGRAIRQQKNILPDSTASLRLTSKPGNPKEDLQRRFRPTPGSLGKPFVNLQERINESSPSLRRCKAEQGSNSFQKSFPSDSMILGSQNSMLSPLQPDLPWRG